MLSDDLDRHISLHHALGFKFRTQSLLLRNFVAYAEARGDQVVSADRIFLGRSKRHRRNSGATVFSKRDASRSRCMRRIINQLGWSAKTADLPNGVTLTVTTVNALKLPELKALGFMGIMVLCTHHQIHHLMMAKGEMVH